MSGGVGVVWVRMRGESGRMSGDHKRLSAISCQEGLSCQMSKDGAEEITAHGRN